MELLTTLGSYGNGPTNLKTPGKLCFTDAGTLLVVDHHNDRVQHWTLEGSCVASYAIRGPQCLDSRGGIFAVGTWTGSGVHVCSLESGVMLHSFSLNSAMEVNSAIYAIAFVDASTLAIYSDTKRNVSLCTLDGKLVKQLITGTGINLFSLASTADGCLVVLDVTDYTPRTRVFAPDGAELTSSALLSAANILQRSIAIRGAHAYVLGGSLGEAGYKYTRICVFE